MLGKKAADYALPNGMPAYHPAKVRRIQVGQARRRTVTDMVRDIVEDRYVHLISERQTAWLRARFGIRNPLDLVHALRFWAGQPGHEGIALLLDLKLSLIHI